MRSTLRHLRAVALAQRELRTESHEALTTRVRNECLRKAFDSLRCVHLDRKYEKLQLLRVMRALWARKMRKIIRHVRE